MKIIWDSMKEVREFIKLAGLKRLSRDEKEWGGLGLIITGRDIRGDHESPVSESYTLHDGDYIVVTPHWKELSWLFRNTYSYPGKLPRNDFVQGFWIACAGYFVDHPTCKPEKVVDFVLDLLVGAEERMQEQERQQECERAGNEKD